MKKFLMPIFFLILTIFSYPQLILRTVDTTNKIKFWSIFEFTTINFLGAIALVIICLSFNRLNQFIKQHKITSYFIGIWLFLALLQQLIIFYSPINFFGMTSYVTIPLLIYLYQAEFKRIFPYYLTLLLIISVAIYISEMIYNPQLVSGISGNWNWSATMFLVTLSAVFMWNKKENKYNFYMFIALILLALIPLYYIAHSPKATIISTILTVAILTALNLKNIIKWRTVLLAFIGGLIMFTAITILMHKQIKAELSSDVRIYLWEAGLNVGFLNPILGCGFDYFASHVKPLLSEGYFLSGHAAVFNPHPHNEIIFAFASFGLIGFAYWGFIIMLGIKKIKECLNDRKLNNYLILFSFLTLFFHAMVDIVLFMFPGNIIFLILLGLISQNDLEVNSSDKNNEFGKFITIILAVVISVYTLIELKNNTLSTLAYNHYKEHPTDNAEKYIRTSIKNRPTPKNLYSLATLQIKQNKPSDTIETLLLIPKLTNFENYNRNHHLLAIGYLQTNSPNLGLQELEKEYNNHPLSVINLYVMYDVLTKMKRENEAKGVLNLLQTTLQKRGNSLEYYFKNPDKDVTD